MDEFAAELRSRIRAAHSALDLARSDDDAYGVTVYSGELDSLLRKAMEHGIEVGPEPPAVVRDAGRQGC